jgi:hypothetical protein
MADFFIAHPTKWAQSSNTDESKMYNQSLESFYQPPGGDKINTILGGARASRVETLPVLCEIQ